MRGVCALAPAALLCAGLPACGRSASFAYQEQLAQAPAPAAHAVHSDRLRALMRGLELLQSDRLPQAMDVEQERVFRVNEVAEVASAMALSASKIREAAGEQQLDPAEREEFDRRAAELEQRLRELADEAPNLPTDEMREKVAGIEETCSGCHRRFLDDSTGKASGP